MSQIGLDDVLPLHLADCTFPPQHPLAGQRGTVYGFAVRHAAGIFVFDTGIGAGNAWVDENFRPKIRMVDQALRDAGLAVNDVIAVANSHLHFDHAGQNARFSNVPIYVQRIEQAAARAEGYTIGEWIDFPGARYETLDGDAEPFPGIQLLATPGHTRGHQSAIIATREGPVVLAGQAVYSVAEWRGEADPGDRSPKSLASAKRLRALGARRVFFGHDAARWDAA